MTQPTQALVPQADNADLALTFVVSPQQALVNLRQLQDFVASVMVKDEDYGLIPGTPKPTLFKPGAEKLCEIYGLAPDIEVLNRVEDWEKGFFHYEVRCRLISKRSGITVATGLGSCNSMEEQYRWRNAKRTCPDCGKDAIIKGKQEWGGGFLCFKKQGGCGAKFADTDPKITSQQAGKVANDEPYTLVNTILKMGAKRALVDATLRATRSSGIFTQDIEDMGPAARFIQEEAIEGEYEEVDEAGPAAARQPPQRPPQTRDRVDRSAQQRYTPAGSSGAATITDKASDAQIRAIFGIADKEHGMNEQGVKDLVWQMFDKPIPELTKRQASEVIDRLKAMPAPAT